MKFGKDERLNFWLNLIESNLIDEKIEKNEVLI